MSSKPCTELVSIEENTLTYRWEGPVLRKTLTLIIDRCVGCGLCVSLCPTQAIALGPVKEVASGRIEAPLITIDESKCVVCPICSSVCPTHALKVNIEGGREYPRIKGSLSLDEEKCLPCHLCERVCPREAIKAEVKVVKKDELVKYHEEVGERAEGKITVNLERCCYCGLCEDLCEAIKIVWVKPEPPGFKPGLTVLVNEQLCDYCGLCEKICPVDAIKVECFKAPPRVVEGPKVDGSIKIDEDLCVYCGLCAAMCPVKALSCEKPFKGEVVMVRPEKCDPSGCKNCINICPTRAVFVSKARGPDKVKAAEEACIFCGACEEACPVEALSVRRREVRVQGGEEPWEAGYGDLFKRLIEGYRPPKEVYARKVTVPVEEYVPPPPRPIPPIPPGFSKVKERVEAALKALSMPKARVLLERGDVERLKNEIRGWMEGAQSG
ncbi:MAG: hypothetical protein DRJ97_02645 [Thermoprotei archaeon]|nr:MAG: hypothetical protein DRJ97_02645 [Thermoprotei archaeon]